MRHLQRKNLLRPGLFFSLDWKRNRQTLASSVVRVEADQLVMSYRHQNVAGEWQDRECPVRLDWTACNYGGQRTWMICPASGCGRRVGVLYLGNTGNFACRHCCELVYDTQRETDGQRAMRRVNNIRKVLGWRLALLNGGGEKPRGMQWRTFRKLKSQHDAHLRLALNKMGERLGMASRKLVGLQKRLDKG
ncbi:hypothetical protein Tbd_2679 [Thiobacillus denitrificans ATCC 25259]|uniref:Uncharacterized protein n=1 Tax=Thiobacillus denitrificans (strain ATCC 25259 / T1) TaxID=292415 RepID=Q3SFH8_THIDA|nr:hypothetical protein [Thiobacillus denitrificans]AAZ98632.1 hypothetical protein Tbd_2679 [Thiobacillus denitrificans ATCC 25259]